MRKLDRKAVEAATRAARARARRRGGNPDQEGAPGAPELVEVPPPPEAATDAELAARVELLEEKLGKMEGRVRLWVEELDQRLRHLEREGVALEETPPAETPSPQGEAGVASGAQGADAPGGEA